MVGSGEILGKNLQRLMAGERKRGAIEPARIKQTVIAQNAGVSQSYISAIERGERINPTLEIVDDIAETFGLTGADLLRDIDGKEEAELRLIYPDPKQLEAHLKFHQILEKYPDRLGEIRLDLDSLEFALGKRSAQ